MKLRMRLDSLKIDTKSLTTTAALISLTEPECIYEGQNRYYGTKEGR